MDNEIMNTIYKNYVWDSANNSEWIDVVLDVNIINYIDLKTGNRDDNLVELYESNDDGNIKTKIVKFGNIIDEMCDICGFDKINYSTIATDMYITPVHHENNFSKIIVITYNDIVSFINYHFDDDFDDECDCDDE